jgi:TfoX/Sxy family transcriptional regulator of competence genes
MFGGYGLYMEDAFFGMVTSEGETYFRTDATTRPEYEAAGMRAFQPGNRPAGPKTMPRNFQVPAHVRSDPPLLREWALRAAAATR